MRPLPGKVSYPKIYLVIDNCFAIKRWVKPSEWMRVIKDIGFSCIEASTDNEFDPLFSTRGYMQDWIEEVRALADANRMRVVNFYTGYQTYRTVGFAHHDPRIREKLIRGWHRELIRHASRLNAGIGFSFFAFSEEQLQDPEKFEAAGRMVLEILADLVLYAWSQGRVCLSVEQMYAPHQPPWTIDGSRKYLRELFSLCGKPSYITIDFGHQVGQRRFQRPDDRRITESFRRFRSGEWVENLWLGPDSAYRLFFDAVHRGGSLPDELLRKMQAEMDRYPYLFAGESDSDTYRWLEELGCYSPIIHMQQTDGVASKHAPFTTEQNRAGIISGDRVLRALASSYRREQEEGMPPRCEAIYLSCELFAANADTSWDTIHRMKETLSYWRSFVPEDGVPLDQLVPVQSM
jgi:hypothetical protein